MISPRQNFPALGMLLIVIAFGAYLRLSHLTSYNLIQEELNHLYVGTALMRGDAPELPSGNWYTRGIEYSRMVGFTLRRIETPEIAVRLPSALLGSMCLIVMAVGTWMMAGPWSAVGATLLLAFYPEAVTQSRLGRFYMLQLLLGLLAFFGGWAVIVRRKVATLWATWLGIIVVTLAWLVAARIQVTAYPMLLAWWCLLAGVGVWDILRNRLTWQRSVPLQIAGVMLLGFGALVIFDPALLDHMILRAMSKPYWTRLRDLSSVFYVRRIASDLLIVTLALPFTFAYIVRRRRGLSVYLLTMLAIPALVFSVVLPFKAERFLLLAIPPVFVATGIAAADAGRRLTALVRSRLEQRSVNTRSIRLLSSAGIVVLSLLTLGSTRSFRRTFNAHWSRIEPDWRAARGILRARDLAGFAFGATKSLPPLFYWERVDFNVGRNFLEQWSFIPMGEAGVASGRVGAYVTLPIGSPDLYAGVPVVITPSQIRDRFEDAAGVVIGIDGQARYFRMVDPALLRVLSLEAEELCHDRCGSLQVYLWRFH